MESILTMKKKKKGFTLIELIIVIAILGILALIAIPKFGQAQKDAKIKADIATGKTIADATATLIAKGKDDLSVFKGKGSEVKTPITKQLGSEVAPTAQAIKNQKFFVVITDDENIKVYVQDAANEVYPKHSGVYVEN